MRISSRSLSEAIAHIRPPDAACREDARELQRGLTKPAGALGRLEELHVWAAGVRRERAPAIGRKIVIVAAADHGVVAEGVSAYPQEVTIQMLSNFLAGGAAINALAAQAGAGVRIVDAGVLHAVPDTRVTRAAVREGSGNIARGPALTPAEAETLVVRGIELVREEHRRGAGAIALGDMGIGNTTSAAAITACIAAVPVAAAAGPGTGIDEETLMRKVEAIGCAIEVNRPDRRDGLDVLAKVGGCEIAFLAGAAIGAAACSLPLVLDGYPTTAAALVAAAIAPASVDYMLASHISAEPGHRIALEQLGLRPLLDLGMRLGEGTGAVLALMLLEAALRIPREMATFTSAGVSRSKAELYAEA